MTATYSQARDEILGTFWDAWEPTGHTVIWPDKPGDKPSGAEPFARVTIRHATGEVPGQPQRGA